MRSPQRGGCPGDVIISSHGQRFLVHPCTRCGEYHLFGRSGVYALPCDSMRWVAVEFVPVARKQRPTTTRMRQARARRGPVVARQR